MNIYKLSDEAAVTTIIEIANGFKQFVKDNPDSAKLLLEAVASALYDLDEDDFFGTEGWVHRFRIE